LEAPDVEWLIATPERIKRCESRNPSWLGWLISTLTTDPTFTLEQALDTIQSIHVWSEQASTRVAILRALPLLAARGAVLESFCGHSMVTALLDTDSCGSWGPDGLAEVRKAAKEVLPYFKDTSLAIELIRYGEPKGARAEDILRCLGIVGPGTDWKVWDYIIHYLLVGANDSGSANTAHSLAANIVASCQLPLSAIQSRLDAIPTEDFRACISDSVSLTLRGLCEILVRQYADSADAAHIVTHIIQRLRSVPREHPGLWSDQGAVSDVASTIRRFSPSVAQDALLRLICSYEHYLLEGCGGRNPWGIGGRFLDGENPQDVFAAAVDDLTDLVGPRTEELLVVAAERHGGTLMPGIMDHVRERLAKGKPVDAGGNQ